MSIVHELKSDSHAPQQEQQKEGRTAEHIEPIVLHPHERLLLKAVKKPVDLAEAAKAAGINTDAAMRAAAVLKERGLIELSAEEREIFTLSEEGKRFVSEMFPEQRVAIKAINKPKVSELDDEERTIGIPWAIRNGWIEIKIGRVIPKDLPHDVNDYDLYIAAKKILEDKAVDVDVKKIDVLRDRGSIHSKIMKRFTLSPTEKGMKFAASLGEESGELGEATAEIIKSGEWKVKTFRRYNVDAPVEKPQHGSVHPIVAFIERIRRIFLNMGFKEVEGPEIEASFWNFDALFQPQDHPARELHDTFYLKRPGYLSYPEDVAQRVKEAHEKGWHYEWNPSIAEQPVLRTHMTAVSARTLAQVGARLAKPGKYFSIGRVYRNEATDYKHLAELHQIDGIIVWRNATFRHLLGCLQEFYRQLGFRKIKFVPHYFPYTEPSVEVHAYFEQRKEWVELGGAGIFRPELTMSLWGDYPVLAWGLGIERPLMLLYNLDDIRTFYRNDLEWLKKIKV